MEVFRVTKDRLTRFASVTIRKEGEDMYYVARAESSRLRLMPLYAGANFLGLHDLVFFLRQDHHLQFIRYYCRVCRMSAKPPSKEISPKLRKTIDRLRLRIKESADYEVHQELKAIASR